MVDCFRGHQRAQTGTKVVHGRARMGVEDNRANEDSRDGSRAGADTISWTIR